MVNISTSGWVAAAVAALINLVIRFIANRQHVRKLQAANAVGLHRASIESVAP